MFRINRSCALCPHLRGEVVLLQLSTLPQIPRPNCVVKAACPKLRPIMRDVDTARAVRVTLELPGFRVGNKR